jgi:hypothetical protein
MKLFQHILQVIRSVYGSADPNLFGSNKRRKEKAGLADEFKSLSDNTQNEIDALQASNPFDSAAAKSAMKRATRTARQYQTRAANMMGANASAEAIVASQQAASEAIGEAAGSIATGAEANKNNQANALRGLQQNQMGSYGAIKTSSIDERGSGWKDFFSSLDSIGQFASGVGQGAGAILGATGGSGAAAAAAGSDINIKENIHFIGTLQGQRIYKYNFKGKPEVHIGVIAQEIEKTDPDKVVMNEGIKKVYYDKVFSEV